MTETNIAPVEAGERKRVITMPQTKDQEVTRGYYKLVHRVPEPGKRAYSKLVTADKADKLQRGIPLRNIEGGIIIVPRSRKYVVLDKEEN